MTPAEPSKPDSLSTSRRFVASVRDEVSKVLVGQEQLIDGLLIGLLADGHVLLEGVPGLAKSLAVQSLAVALGGTFRRIQFTPDLLPSDLVGTQVYHPGTGAWAVREGPVFAHFVLADEINRAPAKVQSALLEAMQERQVSLAGETRALPSPFLVLATQNPVDQEGTYPLPEAQVDRFMLKVAVGYPSRDAEREVVARMAKSEGRPVVARVATPSMILDARREVDGLYVDSKLIGYAVDLVRGTRSPKDFGLEELTKLIRHGASPRASIALVMAARARAWMDGKSFVSPQDVKAVAPMVLRHRVLMTFEAEAQGLTSDTVVARLLDAVPIP